MMHCIQVHVHLARESLRSDMKLVSRLHSTSPHVHCAKPVQAVQAGAFAADLQAFQLRFYTTQAAVYSLSVAMDGVPGFQVGGANTAFEITSAELSVMDSDWSLQDNSVTAGDFAQIAVTGRDAYGAADCLSSLSNSYSHQRDATSRLLAWTSNREKVRHNIHTNCNVCRQHCH
jgi:hypothetical protein